MRISDYANTQFLLRLLKQGRVRYAHTHTHTITHTKTSTRTSI